MKFRLSIFLLTVICTVATILAFYGLSRISPGQLQEWLRASGAWAPIAYILAYVIATLLILPSTALNLTGGAIFGPWFGLLWTTIAAIIAAIAAFAFTRSVGREMVARRLSGRWQAMDAEVRRGGCFYMFAIRLVPIMPYGLVNFAAGLTSVSFKDYVLGTSIGTVPSVLPFVWLGSSGRTALQTGEVWPLVAALALTGVLVAGTTWYRKHHLQPPVPQENDRSSHPHNF